MIKNLFFFILLSVLTLSLNAQEVETKISNYESFEKGTTYFVKTNNADLDAFIEKVFEKYWTINNFKMISESQVANKPKEKSFYASFFSYSYTRDAGTSGALDKDYTLTKLYLFKALSKPKNNSREPEETLSKIVLGDFSPTQVFYSILLMQNQIKDVIDLNIEISLTFKQFLKKISKDKRDVKTEKTLYLDKSILDDKVNTTSKIEKYYDYDVEIKSKEEIDQAIIDRNPNVIYAKFIKIRSLHFLIVIDAGTGELLFGKVSTGFIQDEVNKRFLKKMNK